MKTCSKCGETKESTDFYKMSRSPDGLKVWCKVCCKEYETNHRNNNTKKINARYREYYKTHDGKDKNRDKMQKWREENRESCNLKAKVYCSKRRAKKMELNEKFTMEDLFFIKTLFMDKCFNCGSTDKVSIDHHKPLSKGHVLSIDNAVLLCKSCNSSKKSRDPEDFYSLEKLEELNEIIEIVQSEYMGVC